MGLIDEEKVNKFQKDNELFLYNLDTCAAATLAISFAETELQNLAIEFAIWCGRRYFYSENSCLWVLGTERYRTAELFTKFIEQRNE